MPTYVPKKEERSGLIRSEARRCCFCSSFTMFVVVRKKDMLHEGEQRVIPCCSECISPGRFWLYPWIEKIVNVKDLGLLTL